MYMKIWIDQTMKMLNNLGKSKRLLRIASKQISLGRWKITYEPKMIQSKVDWANVDHCGCCDKWIEKINK
jgi:hypothetical protein